MNVPLIARNIAGLAHEIMQESPITVISGARQVGKSTLMRELLRDREARIVNLDSKVNREAAQADPDGFAAQYPNGTLAIDEIQRVPELLLSMKNALEHDRRPGRFVVTGSSNLLTLRGAEESLAGRAQTVHLHGLSRGELEERVEDFARYMWELPRKNEISNIEEFSRADYLEMILASAYPEIHQRSARSRDRWIENYLERVLSKDLAEVTGIQHPDRLLPLLRVIAAENASEFVAAHVSRSLDIPARSIPTYVQALENVFLVHRLPAWSNNTVARTISKPKISLQDTGVAASLNGADAAGLSHAIASSLTGGLVEGFVTAELMKQHAWSTVDFTLHHFRDRENHEVDIVLENRRREIVGVEVKATASVGRQHFSGLTYLKDKVGDRFVAGAVLYTGTDAVKFGDRLWALPLATLWRV